MQATFRYVKHKPVIRCETCSTKLTGRDAYFTHCDTCSSALLQPVLETEGYCHLHPGCGCQKPSECTEESAKG